MAIIKTDLHCHTKGSVDSKISQEDLLKIINEGKLDKVAITNHNEIDDAISLYTKVPDKIIVGEEISSLEGHIIGLFLTKYIPPHQPIKQVIQQIKAQNGLVYIPHPYSTFRSGIGEETLDLIKDDIDIIEVFNSRSFFPSENSKALNYAKKYNIMCGAASDAHELINLGKTYILIENFDLKESFMHNLKNATLIKKRASIKSMLMPIYVSIRNKLFKK